MSASSFAFSMTTNRMSRGALAVRLPSSDFVKFTMFVILLSLSGRVNDLIVKLHMFVKGMRMADELKDQRVVTMMSPSDLDEIDNWMFAQRIRSRGEAIRRLCQIGIEADKNFLGMVDSYMAATSAALEVGRHAAPAASAEVNEMLTHIVDFGQRFGKLRGAVLTMRQNESVQRAFDDLDEVRRAYATNDTGRALALLRAAIDRSKASDGEE